MHWTASHTPHLLEELEPRLRDLVWPELPPGITRIGPARRMRQVLRGTLPAGPGKAAVRVVVKWSRAVTLADEVSRRWRGGKGPREGRVLRALAEQGVPVPRPLAYTDDTLDLLVTEEIEGLAPLPDAAEATPGLVCDVAALLGRAWRTGLRHRDLHRGNVALVDGRPLLVDLGSARIGRPEAHTVALARTLSGMGGDLSRTQRRRALSAWLDAAGIPVADAELHAWIRRIEDRARGVTRAYRRGRDRRAHRTGRHFELVRAADGVVGIRRQSVSDALAETAAAWLDGLPAGATPLKGASRVARVRLETGESVVVKRYEPVARGRLPRGIRAFRMAIAFANRGVRTPSPLLALAGPDRASLVVSEFRPGPDLHHYTAGGRGGAYGALPPARRRAFCEALGRFLRHLHDQEIGHRDLKAPNLLVELGEAPGSHGSSGFAGFTVLDLDGARRARTAVGWRRRARDVGRLDASLEATRADRARVLDAYWRALPRPPVTKRTFLAWIASYVAWKRARLARRR